MCVYVSIFIIYVYMFAVWIPPGVGLAHLNEHTDGLALAQEKVRKEFSKKTGQALLIRHKAWTDECTKQQTVYM